MIQPNVDLIAVSTVIFMVSLVLYVVIGDTIDMVRDYLEHREFKREWAARKARMASVLSRLD